MRKGQKLFGGTRRAHYNVERKQANKRFASEKAYWKSYYKSQKSSTKRKGTTKRRSKKYQEYDIEGTETIISLSLFLLKYMWLLFEYPFKKISKIKKYLIRFLYEKIYGTTITFTDEVYYIWICIQETFKILCNNFYKKLCKLI